jgi:hypothetical protein
MKSENSCTPPEESSSVLPEEYSKYNLFDPQYVNNFLLSSQALRKSSSLSLSPLFAKLLIKRAT